MDIINEIDKETREVWSFKDFSTSFVFTGWIRQIKPKGKRIWRTDKSWDRYNARHNSIAEPELPESIRKKAHEEATKLIRVLTWSEWKN